MLPKYRRNLLGNYRDQAQRGHIKNVHSFAAAAVCFLLTVPGSQSHCLSNQVFFWMLHYLLPTWLDHQGGSSSWCQLVSHSSPLFMRPGKPLPEPLGRWLQLSPQSFLGRAFTVTLSRFYSFPGSWKDNLSLLTLLDTLRYTAAAVKYHLGAVAARQIWIHALVMKRIHSQCSWIMRYLHVRQTSEGQSSSHPTLVLNTPEVYCSLVGFCYREGPAKTVTVTVSRCLLHRNSHRKGWVGKDL